MSKPELYGNSGDGGARNMGKPGVGEFYPRPIGNQKEGGIIHDGAGPLKDVPMTDRAINTTGGFGATQDFGGSLAGTPKAAVKQGYSDLGKIGTDTASDTTDFGGRQTG